MHVVSARLQKPPGKSGEVCGEEALARPTFVSVYDHGYVSGATPWIYLRRYRLRWLRRESMLSFVVAQRCR